MRLAFGPIVLLLAAGASSSCISFGWQRSFRGKEIAPDALEFLQVGETDLTEALQELGAPLELDRYGEDGMWLAFAWYRSSEAGIGVSVPVYRSISTRFDYDDLRYRYRAVVLFFDQNLMLQHWGLGYLEDLLFLGPSGFLEQITAVADPEADTD